MASGRRSNADGGALGGKSPEEVRLLLEVTGLQESLQHLEEAHQKLLEKNRDLDSKLEQQRTDQADIFYHLHKKLDRNLDHIAVLEQERAALQEERAQEKAALELALSEQQEEARRKEMALQAKIDSLTNDLMELQAFSKMKEQYRDRIDKLEESLKKERSKHVSEIAEIELKKVQEKERLKKEMLIKIKETKKNLLSMTENQLDTTTKRTIFENEQLATELQYQSKETGKLISKLRRLERDNKALKREMAMVNAEKLGLARKASLFKNLSRTLSAAQSAAAPAAAGESGEEEEEKGRSAPSGSSPPINQPEQAARTAELESKVRDLEEALQVERQRVEAAHGELARLQQAQQQQSRQRPKGRPGPARRGIAPVRSRVPSNAVYTPVRPWGAHS